MTIFTTPFNLVKSWLGLAHSAGSGVLVIENLHNLLPDGIPNDTTPIRITCVRASDSVVVVYKATSRNGDILNSLTPIESTADIDLEWGDRAEMRMTAGYLNEIHDAINTLENSNASGFPGINQENIKLVAGTPVTIHPTGIGFLQATALDINKEAVGLYQNDVSAGFSEKVLSEGTMTLSNWSLITGTTSLSPRTYYYLAQTAGMLTSLVPEIGIVQTVGLALTPNTLEILITLPVLL